MIGKIDKNGFLWKDVPGAGWVKCTCVNSACLQTGDFYCYHGCVAFEGPVPILGCTEHPTSSLCPKDCDGCKYRLPSGKVTIKICQGRELAFDQFEDERVPK